MPSVIDARKPEPAMDKTWSRPGAFEVSPAVFRIPLPLPQDGLRAVNVYAIVDGARLVLVDAGWAIDESLEALRTALRGLGFDLADISEFLVTHMHRDHYTQAVAIRRVFGTPISLGEGERMALEAIVDDRARVLFAGDHVLPHITPSIGLEPTLNPLPLGDYLESLALIRARPDAMLLPAHGPVADSVHRRVDEMLDHHERRLTHCAEAVAAGADTAAERRPRVARRRPRRRRHSRPAQAAWAVSWMPRSWTVWPTS
jgi:glyoxylase-like metal-dependent hydrolase (beta-lactamase superfamily II)